MKDLKYNGIVYDTYTKREYMALITYVFAKTISSNKDLMSQYVLNARHVNRQSEEEAASYFKRAVRAEFTAMRHVLLSLGIVQEVGRDVPLTDLAKDRKTIREHGQKLLDAWYG